MMTLTLLDKEGVGDLTSVTVIQFEKANDDNGGWDESVFKAFKDKYDTVDPELPKGITLKFDESDENFIMTIINGDIK